MSVIICLCFRSTVILRLVVCIPTYLLSPLQNFMYNVVFSSDSKGVKTNKSKKKNRRRKDPTKDSSNNVNGKHNKVGASLSDTHTSSYKHGHTLSHKHTDTKVCACLHMFSCDVFLCVNSVPTFYRNWKLFLPLSMMNPDLLALPTCKTVQLLSLTMVMLTMI